MEAKCPLHLVVSGDELSAGILTVDVDLGHCLRQHLAGFSAAKFLLLHRLLSHIPGRRLRHTT